MVQKVNGPINCRFIIAKITMATNDAHTRATRHMHLQIVISPVRPSFHVPSQ